MNHLYRLCVTAILAQFVLVETSHAQSIFGSGFETLPCVLGKKVSWDGGGDGVSWFDAANWKGDVLPADGNTVSIQMTGQRTISFNKLFNTVSVQCLDSNQALSVAGGTLEIIESGIVSPVITITGGTLKATGDLQVVAAP